MLYELSDVDLADMPPLGDAFARILEQAVAARMEFLEKHLALLLREGFPIEDLAIHEHPNHRTVILARGVERFEHMTKFLGPGMDDFQRQHWPR